MHQFVAVVVVVIQNEVLLLLKYFVTTSATAAGGTTSLVVGIVDALVVVHVGAYRSLSFVCTCVQELEDVVVAFFVCGATDDLYFRPNRSNCPDSACFVSACSSHKYCCFSRRAQE